MRDYGTIETSFWVEHAPHLTDGAISLYCYLRTCDHTNMIGVSRIPLGYLVADLNKDSETVSERLAELFERGLVTSFPGSDFRFIPSYFKSNRLSNANMEVCALKAFEQIPDSAPIKLDVAMVLAEILRFKPTDNLVHFINNYETLIEPLSNRSETVSKYVNVKLNVKLKTPIVPASGNDDLSSEQKAGITGAYLLPPHIDTSPPDPGLSEQTLTEGLTMLEHATPKPKRPRKPAADPDAVQRVFAHWRTKMNHSTAKLDTKRRRCIDAAMGMGYTEQQLCDAIDGCAVTPWNMGLTPDNKTRYDQLTLILRNADQIDRFMANKASPPPIDRAVAANNPVAKSIVMRKTCESCKVGFTPGEGYKPVGVWVVCDECRPNAEMRLKRHGEEQHAKRMEYLGMVQNPEGQWVKAQEVNA